MTQIVQDDTQLPAGEVEWEQVVLEQRAALDDPLPQMRCADCRESDDWSQGIWVRATATSKWLCWPCVVRRFRRALHATR